MDNAQNARIARQYDSLGYGGNLQAQQALPLPMLESLEQQREGLKARLARIEEAIGILRKHPEVEEVIRLLQQVI